MLCGAAAAASWFVNPACPCFAETWAKSSREDHQTVISLTTDSSNLVGCVSRVRDRERQRSLRGHLGAFRWRPVHVQYRNDEYVEDRVVHLPTQSL
jgi:hypothetical protein